MASVLLASQGQLTIACGLIFLAALFDVFDGLAARALGGGTPLGAQLDSLADMVSFGMAPAFIIFSLPHWPSTAAMAEVFEHAMFPSWALNIQSPRALTFAPPLVIATASAWRLAKFNIDTRQSTGFLGLPTPANGLFWSSIPLCIGTGLAHNGPGVEVLRSVLLALASPVLASIVALILGTLMLSETPLPSLKFKHGGWKGNEVIFLLIGMGAVLAVLYGLLAVPLVLVLYVLSPLWGRLFRKTSPSREP